ncbi:hypothetical protein CUMW_250610 [Citrus unshiu]|uniref:Uncharacterized protein n=1 Tax=Citrus unshiu TaxID=55188 RepID=A0A2H5QPW5_CITUN|nr:hypothetical protein CUMW_250610 [Citrus unshiu]
MDGRKWKRESWGTKSNWWCHPKSAKILAEQSEIVAGFKLRSPAFRFQSNSFGLTFMYLEVICWSFQLIDCNFARYIKDFQVYDPHRVGKIKVELLGRINDCRALTYRQDVKAREIEGYTVRALPTRQRGLCCATHGVLDP